MWCPTNAAAVIAAVAAVACYDFLPLARGAATDYYYSYVVYDVVTCWDCDGYPCNGRSDWVGDGLCDDGACVCASTTVPVPMRCLLHCSSGRSLRGLRSRQSFYTEPSTHVFDDHVHVMYVRIACSSWQDGTEATFGARSSTWTEVTASGRRDTTSITRTTSTFTTLTPSRQT